MRDAPTSDVDRFCTPFEDCDDSLDEIECVNSGSERAPTVWRRKRSPSTQSAIPSALVRSNCLLAYASSVYTKRGHKKPGRRKARRWANDEFFHLREGEMSLEETDDEMEDILSHLMLPCTAGMSSIVFLASEGPDELIEDILQGKGIDTSLRVKLEDKHRGREGKNLPTQQFLLIPRRMRKILARTVVHNSTLLDLLCSLERFLSLYFSADNKPGAGATLTPCSAMSTLEDEGSIHIVQVKTGPNGLLEFWNPSSIYRLVLHSCCIFYDLALVRESHDDGIGNLRDFILKVSRRRLDRPAQRLLSETRLSDVVLTRFSCR